MSKKEKNQTWIVVAGGIAAALHIGKLPPAIPVLQEQLGVTLVQAGFMLALVQLGGLLLGMVAGLLADGMGLKRGMVVGLLMLAASSVLGGFAQDAATLLVLRGVEGCGLLLAAMPGPGLIRRLAPPARINASMSLWSMYMPVGMALGLIFAPLIISAVGWAGCWFVLAVPTLVIALLIWRVLPDDPPRVASSDANQDGWLLRVRQTLAAPGPWLLALTFLVYAAQWSTIIGFLPSVYAQAGVSSYSAGLLTAVASLTNIFGNVGSGRLLHARKNFAATARGILAIGFAVMALTATIAFAEVDGQGLPAVLRYAAVLVFSAIGGAIPGTLFALAVRLAPSDRTVGTVVGWMQQGSSAGQFFLPPLAGWMAERAGGWHWTWVLTGACALVGMAVAWRIGVLLGKMAKP